MCFLFAMCFLFCGGGLNPDSSSVSQCFIVPVLYPVSVPVLSVYCSFREIFLGEDWTERDNILNLTYMKMLKMAEHIGEFYVPNN